MAVTIGSVTEGNANAEEIKNNSPDSELYENNKKYLQGSLVKFNDKIYLAKRNVPSDVDLDNPYYWEIFMDAADSKRVDELFEKTGNLDELETESKDNLVEAINEVGSIQPDWAQNDETAKDYIKNRTHWIEEKTVLEETTFTIEESDDSFVLGNFPVTLSDGDICTVVYDGKTYTCTVFEFGTDIAGISCDAFEIVFQNQPDGLCAITIGAYAGEHTISILQTTYHTIPDEFIPWEESPTADSILYTAQSLTEEQQAQARANIGAPDLSTCVQTNKENILGDNGSIISNSIRGNSLTISNGVIEQKNSNQNTISLGDAKVVFSYDSDGSSSTRGNGTFAMYGKKGEEYFKFKATNGDVKVSGIATPTLSNDAVNKSYVDLQIANIEIPTVPTNVSAFTNDAGYLTEHQSLADYALKSEIPSPYSLPTASATELGGVKADSAEATDTQPVRIGGDGKLYTAAGGGSGGASDAVLYTEQSLTEEQQAQARENIDSGVAPYYVAVDRATGTWGTVSKEQLSEMRSARNTGKPVILDMKYSGNNNPRYLPLIYDGGESMGVGDVYFGYDRLGMALAIPNGGGSLYKANLFMTESMFKNGDAGEALSIKSKNSDGSIEFGTKRLGAQLPELSSSVDIGLIPCVDGWGSHRFMAWKKPDEIFLGGAGGTDISLGLTSASVGQIIKVKAVDESGKPTEWEVADMPSGGADGSGVTEYHASNNLYDVENLVGTHTINGSSVSGLSNWIPVKAKTKYASDAHHTQYYFFDKEKNYLSGATYITSPVVVTAPQDGFLLIKTNGDTGTIVVEGTDLGNYYDGYYALKESLTKRVSKADNNTWEGKKWLAIGDSLTDPAVASEGYPYIVSKALGLTLTNVGASGKVMNWFVDLIPDYADDFDLVTVMLGTNNQGYNCGIGSLNDGVDYTTNNSFYAQTQKVAEVLMEKYPTAVIAFLTPIRRTGVDGQNNNDEGYMINALGLTTEPYAEAVKEVADYYGLPCLDLYHNGINPKSEWMRQLYFVNSDGTHPNNKGHAKYIAPMIKAFLESLAPFGEKTVTYSVTNNLTNAENSNAATYVFEGSAYSANITATSGYVLSSVTVSMGGEDVTGTVYADGAITIGAVTGDIVITATATATSVTTYTITNTLTNATNSNSAASVEEGASYSATITANEGYELGEVTVTMGGTDISASAVSGGTITIESVTGNIVITATATKVDSGEPVLVHSYIGTSVPASGVLEDQTGSFDLTHNSGSVFFSNYADANGSAFALSTGDSASFKFVNAYRNTMYFSHSCKMNTSGCEIWNITVGGNFDNTGRIAVYPYGNPEGVTGVFGDAMPQVWYRQDDDADGTEAETKLYSNVTIPKGETHTITVTVNAADKSIKMYVDGTIAIDEFMTTEPQFDGLSVSVYNDCPFDRLEVYRGIITNVT